MTRYCDLRKKEVVNVYNGKRLGFICDLVLDVCSGRITAIVVPGPCRFFFIVKTETDYVIPWKNICKIGEDVILVEVDENCCPSGCR